MVATRGVAGWVAVTAALLLPTSAALAEEAAPERIQEARERTERGQELFETGDLDGALVEFERAYELVGDHPNRYLLLYNMAQCHAGRYRYDEALRLFRQYLDEGGQDADGRAEVEADVARMMALVGRVAIEVNVAEAEVWIEGRRLGVAPSTIQLPAGMHVLELRASGFQPSRHQIRVVGQEEQTLSVTLEPVPERVRGLHQAYFWAAVGLTIAATGGAIGLGVSTLQAHDDVERRLSDDVDRRYVTQDDINGITSLALATDLVVGAAALFAAGSLALGLLTDWGHERAGEAFVLTVGAAAGGGGVAAAWSF